MARILVIEDNPDNLELMTYLLRAFGHWVASARDGVEGLAVVRRDAFDLIVCDVHLPKADGYAVASQLKADPELRRIPLLAVTALAMVGDRDKVLAAGFDGYLAKPIDPQLFVRQVEGWLPAGPGAETGAAAPAPVPAASAPQPPSRAHILVVDDSPANREVMHAILVPSGYTVSTASNTQEGLALAQREPFQLILSDLHMPKEDGFQFLEALKRDPRLRPIPVAIVTASVWGDRERQRALALGAVRFLMRPLDPEQLLAEVAACLQQ